MRFSSGRQSQVACISELHPAKTQPCFNSNTMFLSWSRIRVRPSRQAERVSRRKWSISFIKIPLSLFLFVYFLAYLFSVVNSPYAKHIDCGKALENAHLCRLYPCAWARCKSSAGCLEVVDITSSFGQAAESALCIKWGLPKDHFRSLCQEFCSTINLNVAIRIW